MIEWKSTLDTGIVEIDNQHHEWVKRSNDFSIAVNKGATKEIILEFLIAMNNYTIFHFGEEEALMHNINYPEIDTQLIQHQLFLGKQAWFLESLRFAEDVAAKQTAEFIENWITYHIFVEDKKIGEYMAHMPKE